ncbi:hypothetical protein [Ancylobacter lacus]|uniref:hypothetical protein n=1 Tax=Ancylobacter lacus TaxID=2579970 RepID=UPI001BD13D68|nr:hypothetical protein [Ancylobacter lacus]
MSAPTFLPGPRISNLVVACGMGTLAWAFWLRYAVLEQSAVGQACASVVTGTCVVRATTLSLIEYSAFGIAALVLAAIQLVRPSVAVFTLALMASAAGVVFYNANTAALAAGLLLISFARPWRGARS